MNKRYCQTCGTELTPVGDHRNLWIQIYECQNAHYGCDYLEVADSRLIFPLQILESDVKQLMLAASPELAKLAVSRIKQMDYKTVSIVGFEQTLRGIFRVEESERDGTERPGT